MATSLVHVLTIIGRAAQDVESVCENLLAKRNPREHNGHGSDNWSTDDHVEIEYFCPNLIVDP